MKITALNIENYGPFRDLAPLRLSPQLTVIAGPNEAGKSALRAFMWMVLFGRKRANAPDARWFNYKHSDGGSGRGGLVVHSNGTEYTVFRSESGAPAISDGATTAGQERLSAITGHIDGTLYQRVFSINLTELGELGLLSDEQVKGRIHSAGLGLGSVTLPGVKKAIEDERSTPAGLWSERGGRLRTGLRELEGLNADLASARAALQGYETLNGRIAVLSSDIEASEARRRDLNIARERLRQVQALRGPWNALVQLRRQLRELPDTGAFPADGASQIDELVRKIDAVSEQLRAGEAENAKRRARIAQLPVIEAFKTHETAVRAVAGQASEYGGLVRDLPGREQVKTSAEMELRAGLGELGAGWDEARVAGFDDAGAARVELRRVGATLSEAVTAREEARTGLASLEREAEGLRVTLESAVSDRDRLGQPPSGSAEVLAERRRLLEQLRLAVLDRDSYGREVRDLETRRVLTATAGPVNFGLLLPAIAGLAGFALAAWGAVSGEVSGLVGGALALAVAAAVWWASRRSRDAGLDPGDAGDDHLGDVRSLLASATAEAGRLAGELGLDAVPPARDVQAMVDEVSERFAARQRFDLADDAVQRATASVERSRQSVVKAEALLKQREEASTAAEAEWRAALRRWSFADTLEAAEAADLISNIERVKLLIASAEVERERVDGIVAAIERIDGELAAVLAATGSEPATPRQGLAALKLLQDRYESDVKARVELENLELQNGEWQVSADSLQDRRDRLETTKKELLAAAGVGSEDEFRRLADAYATRLKIEAEIRGREQDHPMLVSAEGEPYREELSRQSLEEVAVRIAELGDEIDALERSAVEMGGERRSREEERRRLEASNPVAELQSEIGVLAEQVRADAGRWAVLTIAAKLIDNASKRFQDQRQAPLLNSASGYFRSMTRGEYTAIQQVLGEDRILALHRGGATKEVTELSRGTVEQMFLALRFALIEEYCRSSEPMPILLDDVLVNFDPGRAAKAAESIIQLSARHQVIALTCHPATVETFRQAALDAGVTPPVELTLGGD